MYSLNSGYQNLENVYPERDPIAVSKRQLAHDSACRDNGTTNTELQWYWRLLAQTSVWMILGGYLIFPSTFDTSPQLRFSKSVLAIIIVGLLTGGYSLTLLLFLCCPSLPFHQESIFIPTASASLFSFLAILYCLAASSRYTFAIASCPIALALSATSATLYSALAFYTSRRINAPKPRSSHGRPRHRTHHRNPSPYNDARYSPGYGPDAGTGSTSAPPTSGLWMEPNYYSNFIVNMHPTARALPINKKDAPSQGQVASLYDPATGTTYTRFPGGATEDELVAQQMAALLRRRESGPSADASGSTFRLDWDFNEEEGDGEAAVRREATLDEGRARKARARRRSAGEGRARGGPVVRITRADDNGRGRSEIRSGGEGKERAKSREERRREIELENLGT